FDVPGIVLLSGAMCSLIFAIIKTGDGWSWSDGRTWGLLALSLVCFAAFAYWQTRAKEPLVPLAMFRSVALSAGTVLMVLMAIAFLGG
ncbi:MFS transporter, partial [Streptomyces sp. SID11233]|nr:MFS transporter [Streptomyces sp. SID11233]